MKLIEITKHDFSEWKAFRKQVYKGLDDGYDSKEMESIINSNDWSCYFIANDEDKVLGLIELSVRNIVDSCLSSPVAYLEGFYIKEEYRNMGLGSETMNIILEWCKEKGFSELATDAELENVRAQKFYKDFGFEETDRVVEFKINVNNK